MIICFADVANPIAIGFCRRNSNFYQYLIEIIENSEISVLDAILEAAFWMQPFVHNLLLDWFNNPPTSLGYEMQALVLKKLFINQGFYNLFFCVDGIVALYQLKKNNAVGYGLMLLVCFAAFGAGLVLAVTSNAYLLAFLQAVPAAIAFYNIYPFFIAASANKN